MRYILLAAVLSGATAFLLTGCLEPDPVVTKPEDAQALVDHITYVKDKRGICYAVASVHRISTGAHLAENVMFTAVDCEKAGL
jgi:hypothetical protein